MYNRLNGWRANAASSDFLIQGKRGLPINIVETISAFRWNYERHLRHYVEHYVQNNEARLAV